MSEKLYFDDKLLEKHKFWMMKSCKNGILQMSLQVYPSILIKQNWGIRVLERLHVSSGLTFSSHKQPFCRR